MPNSPVFPGTPRTQSATAQQPYMMYDLWNPGENGSRVARIAAATNDSTPKQVYVFELFPMTLEDNMGDGALDDGSPDTITRTAGSFVADGWRIGDSVVVRGATTAANNAAWQFVTNVASGTLTLSASGLYAGEALPAQSKLYRAILRGRLEEVGAEPPGWNSYSYFGAPRDILGKDESLMVSGESILAFSMITGGSVSWVQLHAEGADF